MADFGQPQLSALRLVLLVPQHIIPAPAAYMYLLADMSICVRAESFFEPVHAILGLDAAAAISPAEADHPARDAAEFLESSSPAHVPDPSIASSMIAHDGASSTASLQEVQSATLEPPVEALPIVAAAAAAAAAASTPVLSPFTARARTALPSDSDDPVEVDSGDVIETLGDGASTPGGCIPTAQQQVEAALQQELGVAASLEIMQAMQLPTGHEAADANGWDDLMSTEPPPILDGGKVQPLTLRLVTGHALFLYVGASSAPCTGCAQRQHPGHSHLYLPCNAVGRSESAAGCTP